MRARIHACAKAQRHDVCDNKPSVQAILPTADAVMDKSYEAAKAIVGGRYKHVQAAMADKEFPRADAALIHDFFTKLRSDAVAVEMCEIEESHRRKRLLVETLAVHPENARTTFNFIERQLNDLLKQYGSTAALTMSDAVHHRFAWSFELAPPHDKRYYSGVARRGRMGHGQASGTRAAMSKAARGRVCVSGRCGNGGRWCSNRLSSGVYFGALCGNL